MPPRAITDGLFEMHDDGSIVLVGGYSPSSGRFHFPELDTCPYAGTTDVETVVLSTEGTLWAWTAVTAAPPGYAGTIPFGFGVVELGREQLRVITRLTEPDPSQLAFGQRMRLVAETLPLENGETVTTWAFKAAAHP
ncbi:MAG: Zn-ribbon domain-containing OB-fold protein [Acidimicrobiia bacterium]